MFRHVPKVRPPLGRRGTQRVITGTRLYEAVILPAYLDFLPRAFEIYGLPLALYVDYHSFFFSYVPDALTYLGQALHFYDISFKYAPTPQAKDKVERLHQFWQNRLPTFFAAERIQTLTAANPAVDQGRLGQPLNARSGACCVPVRVIPGGTTSGACAPKSKWTLNGRCQPARSACGWRPAHRTPNSFAASIATAPIASCPAHHNTVNTPSSWAASKPPNFKRNFNARKRKFQMHADRPRNGS